MILFDKTGASKLFTDEDGASALASGEYADSPAHWGIESCPGVDPDPALAARRAELATDTSVGAKIAAAFSPAMEIPDSEFEPTSVDQYETWEVADLQSLAESKGIIIDRRWGKAGLIEVMTSDDSA